MGWWKKANTFYAMINTNIPNRIKSSTVFGHTVAATLLLFSIGHVWENKTLVGMCKRMKELARKRGWLFCGAHTLANYIWVSSQRKTLMGKQHLKYEECDTWDWNSCENNTFATQIWFSMGNENVGRGLRYNGGYAREEKVETNSCGGEMIVAQIFVNMGKESSARCDRFTTRCSKRRWSSNDGNTCAT